MVPLNKSGLVRAKPGNFILKSLNRCFSNYYQVRTWPVFAETVTYYFISEKLHALYMLALVIHGVHYLCLFHFGSGCVCLISSSKSFLLDFCPLTVIYMFLVYGSTNRIRNSDYLSCLANSSVLGLSLP